MIPMQLVIGWWKSLPQHAKQAIYDDDCARHGCTHPGVIGHVAIVRMFFTVTEFGR